MGISCLGSVVHRKIIVSLFSFLFVLFFFFAPKKLKQQFLLCFLFFVCLFAPHCTWCTGGCTACLEDFNWGKKKLQKQFLELFFFVSKKTFKCRSCLLFNLHPFSIPVAFSPSPQYCWC